MKRTHTRRGARLAGLIAATAVAALIAPSVAQASAFHPGKLKLTPSSGSLQDKPIASYQATKACPAANRALANVSLDEGNGVSDPLTQNFIPTATPPSGSLSIVSLGSVVLSSDLPSGGYRLDLLCYNDDFSSTVTADSVWIHIDNEAGTWHACGYSLAASATTATVRATS